MLVILFQFYSLKCLMVIPNCLEVSLPYGETTTTKWSPRDPSNQVLELLACQPVTVNEVGEVIIEWPRKPAGVSLLVGLCRILAFLINAAICMKITILILCNEELELGIGTSNLCGFRNCHFFLALHPQSGSWKSGFLLHCGLLQVLRRHSQAAVSSF